MPKMSGFDLARRARASRKDIPILLCTGFQEKDIVERIAKAGMSGYFMKPIDRREMAQAIREALGTARAGLPAQGKR